MKGSWFARRLELPGEVEPPGRTGWSLLGREKEADRDEELEDGRRALSAVFCKSEGEGTLGARSFSVVAKVKY